MGYTWEHFLPSYSLKMARKWQLAGGDAGADGKSYGAVATEYPFHWLSALCVVQSLWLVGIINLLVNTMVTVHIMGLHAEPFEMIRSGKKTIELRLFDEKRKTIQLGDVIEFQKQPKKQETLRVEVIALLRYRTFAELFDDFPIESFGGTDKASLLESVHRFYTPERELKKTVLGVKIKLLV